MSWGEDKLTCLDYACTYTEPLPADLALRLRGARELPGLGLRAG